MFKYNHLGALVSATLALSCGAVFADVASMKASSQSSTAETEVDIKKLSEAFGHFIGKNLKNSGLNFDVDTLIQGIKNGNDGKPAPLTEQEYEKGMLALQERALKKIAEDNLTLANKYLADNAKKDGVVVLEPGKLQYVIVTKGDGAEVKENGTPKIEYKGQYIDGTVFGNSQDSGGPISLPLDQTIPGFAKAIKGMKEGETRRLFVHPDLGYGTSGQLPPNSLLIFEVKVIKAEAPKDDAEAADDDDEEENPPLAELEVKVDKTAPLGATAATNASTQKTNVYKSTSTTVKTTDKTDSNDDYDDEDDDIDDEDDDEDLDDDDDYDDEDEDDHHSSTSNNKKK